MLEKEILLNAFHRFDASTLFLFGNFHKWWPPSSFPFLQFWNLFKESVGFEKEIVTLFTYVTIFNAWCMRNLNIGTKYLVPYSIEFEKKIYINDISHNGTMIFLNQTGHTLAINWYLKMLKFFVKLVDIYCLGHIYMKIDLIYIFLLQGFKSRAVPKNVALYGKSRLRNIYWVLRRR